MYCVAPLRRGCVFCALRLVFCCGLRRRRRRPSPARRRPPLSSAYTTITHQRQPKSRPLFKKQNAQHAKKHQALAKESDCFFLNVTASAVMSKWLGDANRLVRAIFTLAAKLQPCVIFIGECWF